MKTKLSYAAVVCLLLLSACGGGAGKLSDSGKSSALSACTPSSGPAGTEVSCASGGMTEDSTLFFDKKPVEFTLGEDGTVTFTVPPSMAGEKTIYFQEGDSGVRPIGSFEVTGAVSPGSDQVEPAGGTTTGGTAADAGDVITPSGTGGGTTGGTTGGATTGEAPPPDADGDGVADASDACPGTVSGTTVDSTGCPPAPPQPASAAIDSFTVTKVADTSARLMTFKVSFAYSNAKAAYIWGNMLNRTSGDGDLAAADQCKVQGGRYLVTNPDGSNLNSGSANYTKWKYLSEGTACGSSNCQSGPTALLEEPKPGSRFNDRLAGRDRYAYQPVQIISNLKYDPNYLQVNPGYVFLLEKNPDCRVDLEDEGGNPVNTGEFYTRSQVQYGKLCLAVQGKDDQWKVQCLSGDKLNAPAATLNDPTVSVSSTKAAFGLHFSVINATKIDVQGCTKTSSDVSVNSGKGTYDGECAVDAVDKTFTVTVKGVGENNADTKKYAMHLGAPEISFKVSGSEPTGDQEQDFKFSYKAARDYTLKTGDTVVASGKAPWFASVYFKGFPGGDDTHAVNAPGDVDGSKTAHWSPTQTSWTFGVIDFDGTKSQSTWGKSLQKSFYVTANQGNNGGQEYIGGGACNTTPNLRLYMVVVWHGTNVKSISSSDCSIDAGQSDTSNAGKFGEHTGYLHAYKDYGQQDGTWDRNLTCTFTGKYLDNSDFSFGFTLTGLGCH